MPCHHIAKLVQHEAIRQLERDGEIVVSVLDDGDDVWIYTQLRLWGTSRPHQWSEVETRGRV